MIFSEKYISTTDAALDAKNTKVVIGDDAFAIGEMLSELIKKLEQARISLIK